MDVEGRLQALLQRAQFGYTAKTDVWKVLTADLPDEAKLGALHAQDLPPDLFSAITELLAARR